MSSRWDGIFRYDAEEIFRFAPRYVTVCFVFPESWHTQYAGFKQIFRESFWCRACLLMPRQYSDVLFFYHRWMPSACHELRLSPSGKMRAGPLPSFIWALALMTLIMFVWYNESLFHIRYTGIRGRGFVLSPFFCVLRSICLYVRMKSAGRAAKAPFFLMSGCAAPAALAAYVFCIYFDQSYRLFPAFLL